jgi:serine/threonine protein kinase
MLKPNGTLRCAFFALCRFSAKSRSLWAATTTINWFGLRKCWAPTIWCGTSKSTISRSTNSTKALWDGQSTPHSPLPTAAAPPRPAPRSCQLYVCCAADRYARKSWRKFITEKNQHLALPEAIDLLDKCLVYDHADRITAKQAMAHPYFDPVRPTSASASASAAGAAAAVGSSASAAGKPAPSASAASAAAAAAPMDTKTDHKTAGAAKKPPSDDDSDSGNEAMAAAAPAKPQSQYTALLQQHQQNAPPPK